MKKIIIDKKEKMQEYLISEAAAFNNTVLYIKERGKTSFPLQDFEEVYFEKLDRKQQLPEKTILYINNHDIDTQRNIWEYLFLTLKRFDLTKRILIEDAIPVFGSYLLDIFRTFNGAMVEMELGIADMQEFENLFSSEKERGCIKNWFLCDGKGKPHEAP